ncbi:MobA/MobL family protein [Streptococcus pneumoniae]|nr:MobA/MobL family protein [Streptococcus pneumoniae]
MADSFHFSVNIISRGKGKSAVASAAYISGEKIKNEWDGVTHDYTRKEKILVKNIILPDHIPKEFNDRSTLWNKVEMAEKNSNAQLARQFIIGLPKELSLSENKNLVERYIKENLTSQGMIVDYAIHDESQDKNGNIHCHIMTIMRPINEKGEFLAKSKKEYILDEKGEKVLNKNGKPKTRKVELTTWNDTGNVEQWRENFSDLCNKYLERAGAEKRVDHRSFKRQNSDYLPTIHLGSAASAMERKGIETDKGNYNREIRKYNQLVKTIKEEISKEAGQAAQTIISYTIKATKESINLEKEIRKKMNETLEKANGNLKSLMGDEMKIKDLYKKGQLENISIDQIDLKDLKKELNKLGVSFSVMKNKESKNYEIFFQAKDIKVMEYAFKQVIAKENKKEKESILKQIKKYKDLSKNKDKTKEKGKRKVKEKVKPNKKDMTREI